MTYASTLRSRLRLLALTVGLPFCAWSAPAPPVDDSAAQLDANIQALKAEVLDINQRELDTEEDFLFPEQTRVNVYVGVRTGGLLLNEFVVTIDAQPPSRRAYSTQEAILLQRRGLNRMLRLNVPPGAHRIKADFTGHFADADPAAPLLRGHLEAVFEKSLKTSDLEFTVSQEGYLTTPVLKLRDWRAAP